MTLRSVAVFLLLVACVLPARAESLTRDELQKFLDSTVHSWRFQLGEVPGAEASDFDDSQWRKVEIGFRWLPHDSTCWFRTQIVLPDQIQGIAVAGSPVLLKLAVDNGAKVYVNGQLKQEFQWHEGRVVLTENATPGETFVVALHGVNGPGHGSLLDAHLTASEPMTGALGDLLDSFDIAESDADYVPASERRHWLDRAQTALNEIDLQAFRERREEKFVASVERAWSAYLQDAARLEERLDESARKLAQLKELLQQGKAKGLQLAYERLDARVVESFLTYARQDSTDRNRRHQVRALKIASYLDRLCDDAIESARARIDQPERELRVPVAAVRNVSIRDGAFWSGDRPVMFTGVGHFDQIRRDIPILNDYGLNIIQLEIGPSRVLTAPGTVDDRSIRDDILPALDNAARHHVAVNLLISPHYFPKWALDKNPQHVECGYGFLKYCIDAPDARRVHEQFLRTLMPLVAHHPALHSICLSNEPQYLSKCPLARKKFHAWLRRRHGTIDAVNAIYGSEYRAIDDVPIPDRTDSYPRFYDWCCFNQDNLLEFHTFLRDLVHEVRDDLPVHAKVMSRAFSGPEQFELGVDHEQFNLLGSISGNDCWQMFDYKPESQYAQGWLVTAMNYTLQHSTAPANPIFNSEDHIIPDGEERYVPAAHIRTAFWTQALHGQCAATTWVWERGQDGDLAENILTRPNCVRALGRIGMDLNRLAPEVHALQQTSAEMAILYPHSSLLPSWDYVNETEAAFEGAYFADTVCDFITERQVAAGGLDRYKLIVVPRASHAPDKVVEAFQQYIAAGGTVMTVGDCLTQDPYGRPRAKTLQQEGAGRLVAYPGPLSSLEHRRRIDRLLDTVGADRPVRIVGTDGQPVWGVHLRATRQEQGALVTLVNFLRHPQTVDLVVDGSVKRIVNLFDNTEVTLPLVLDSLDPVLLSFE